jgi:invasion protein IalB
VLINWLMAVTDNQLTATIQTPTGVLITPGIDLKIGRAVKKVAFTRCDAQRCESTFPLDDGASKDLAAADVVELSIRGGQNNPVTFNIPVKGYERALQALRAKP